RGRSPRALRTASQATPWVARCRAVVREIAERLSFSPSDLNDFLECEHLTALELRRARGELDYSPPENPQAHLIQEKGQEHEAAYLELLEAAGSRIARIHPIDSDWDFRRAAAETEEAMRDGADV